jgi:hypothetical protein
MPRMLRLGCWAVLFPVAVWAAVVTAQQIAAAVRASPGASAWLRENAEAAANLAIRVESRGNTQAYNGSCCYGVLQMNTRNIAYYGKGMTPAQYLQLDLQGQINMWTRLTTDALRARAPRELQDLGTFDGRPVDGHLVLACVQLGIGNCQRMINRGSCSGFADRHGTTICSMADRMAGGAPPGGQTGVVPTTPPVPTPTVSPALSPGHSCVQGPGGECLPIAQALEAGFEAGSGELMGQVKQVVQAAIAGVLLLVIASLMSGVLRQYARGRMDVIQLKGGIVKAGLVAVTITLVLSMV